MSFMPSGAQWIILGAVAGFLVFVALFVYLNRIDAPSRPHVPRSDKRTGWRAAIRILLVILLPPVFFGAVLDAGEHRRLVGRRFCQRAMGDTVLHVGFRIRRAAQRSAGLVHPSAQPEGHG